MTQTASGNVWEAYLESLVELGSSHPGVTVVELTDGGVPPAAAFSKAFPQRLERLGSSDDLLRRAAESARSDRPVYGNLRASLLPASYGTIRQAITYPRSNVKLVVQCPWPTPATDANGPGPVEDIGLMRGLPQMTVAVPADGPTVRAAARAVADLDGPAYLHLAEGDHPVLTDGTFAVGRANTVRDGSDLTIVAAGPLLGAALLLETELRQVGVSVRVLDLASVKPVDAPALLRAARDTGAILVAEEHTVETGLGELVAAIVSENLAVPVRRVGVPDLFAVPTGPQGGLGPAGDRMRDEAWELLRLRGKVQ